MRTILICIGAGALLALAGFGAYYLSFGVRILNAFQKGGRR